MAFWVRPKALNGGLQHVGIGATDTADHAVGIACPQHAGTEVRTALEQPLSVRECDAFPRPSLGQFRRINALSALVLSWVHDGVVELEPKVLDAPLNAVGRTEEDGVTDLLVGQLSRSTEHAFLITFWEHDALSSSADLVDHAAHEGVALPEPTLKLLAVAQSIELIG